MRKDLIEGLRSVIREVEAALATLSAQQPEPKEG